MEPLKYRVEWVCALVRWEGARAMRMLASNRLAWTGLCVLGLLFNLVMWSWAKNQEALLSVATSEQVRVTARGASTVQAPASQPVSWGAFETVLANSNDVTGVLQQILQVAESGHVVVLSGDYGQQSDVDGHFVRSRMSMPVKGNARDIRLFIERALRDHPALTLQAIQFKRAQRSDQQVEARIEWVLLTRESANPGGTP